MSNFYGSINNAKKLQWSFDKVYANKKEMLEDISNNTDGVFLGRFMLVAYGESSEVYNQNYHIDREKYGETGGFDGTVWQKIYTEGEPDAQLVAKISATMPTMKLVIDAPTNSPIAPYFDSNSSNQVYNLHMQPSPGFWISPADHTVEYTDSIKDYPSDVKTNYYKYTYDSDTDSVITTTIDEDVDAAIYFNKQGLDPLTIHYSEDDDYGDGDYIDIKLTGKSGNEYGSDERVQPDTNELIMMLPSIGDTIASAWDLIYGGRLFNRNNVRNQDIAWIDPVNDVRTVEQNESRVRLTTDTTLGVGFEKNKANTIAGAINTAHDVIGMIIVDSDDDENVGHMQEVPTDNAFSTYDKDKIYYKQGTYYQISTDYEAYPQDNNQEFDDTASETLNGKPHFEEVALTAPVENYYFKKAGNNYYLIRDVDDFKKDQTYYTWVYTDGDSNQHTLRESFTQLSLAGYGVYEPNKYYIKDGDNYKLSTDSEPSAGQRYYQIDTEDVHYLLDDEHADVIWFAPNRFYKYNLAQGTVEKDSSANWDDNPGSTDHYNLYLVDSEAMATEPNGDEDPEVVLTNQPTIYVNVTNQIKKWNSSINYYLYDEEEKTYKYVADDVYGDIWSDDSDAGATTEDTTAGVHSLDDIARVGPVNVCTISKVTEVDLYAPGDYYYINNPITQNTNLDNTVSVIIDDVESHVIGDIILETSKERIEGRVYYTKQIFAAPAKVEYEFYRSDGDYYLEDTNAVRDDFIIGDDNNRYIPSYGNFDIASNYYKKFDKYVYSDANNYYTQFSKWNPSNNSYTTIPEGVILCWLKEKQVFKELEGYARDKNTINGLILQTNHKLGEENSIDESTVNGVINKAYDVLKSAQALTYGTFVEDGEPGTFLRGTLEWPGLVQLNSSINSSAQDVAATPYAVKQLHDTMGLVVTVHPTVAFTTNTTPTWVIDNEAYQTGFSCLDDTIISCNFAGKVLVSGQITVNYNAVQGEFATPWLTMGIYYNTQNSSIKVQKYNIDQLVLTETTIVIPPTLIEVENNGEITFEFTGANTPLNVLNKSYFTIQRIY